MIPFFGGFWAKFWATCWKVRDLWIIWNLKSIFLAKAIFHQQESHWHPMVVYASMPYMNLVLVNTNLRLKENQLIGLSGRPENADTSICQFLFQSYFLTNKPRNLDPDFSILFHLRNILYRTGRMFRTSPPRRWSLAALPSATAWALWIACGIPGKIGAFPPAWVDRSTSIEASDRLGSFSSTVVGLGRRCWAQASWQACFCSGSFEIGMNVSSDIPNEIGETITTSTAQGTTLKVFYGSHGSSNWKESGKRAPVPSAMGKRGAQKATSLGAKQSELIEGWEELSSDRLAWFCGDYELSPCGKPVLKQPV